MNIYLVERTDKVGYDEFDSFVVIAKDEIQAKYNLWHKSITGIKVTLIGFALEGLNHQVIHSSFNAG